MGKGITKCVPYSCTLELLEVSRRPFGNRNARKKAHTKPSEQFHLNRVAGKAQQISNFQKNQFPPVSGFVASQPDSVGSKQSDCAVFCKCTSKVSVTGRQSPALLPESMIAAYDNTGIPFKPVAR